jgi:hypothetical protein
MTIKSQGGVFGRNPTFNNVAVDGSLTVGGSTALVASNIGSTVQAYDADTAKLDVAQTFTANQIVSGTLTAQVLDAFEGSSTTQLRVGASANYYWDISRDNVSTGDLVISNYNASSVVERARFKAGGNLAFPSGNGIDFSATAGTGTSELFDDYEEGTWTPTVTSGSGTVTLDDATGSFYTKIGRTVQIFARFAISTDASVGTSDLTIGGLPYAVTEVGTGNFTSTNYSAGDYGTGGAHGFVYASSSSISHVARTVNISSRATFYWSYYVIYTAS